MVELSKCPRCQSVMRSDRLGGLCPQCTWRGFAESADEAAGAMAGSMPRGLLAVPGHEVQEEIARGGMGIVYRAEQLEPRRTVALKMLLPGELASPVMRERFRLEARAIASLEHPAILPVYQVGEFDGLPFFTMKLAAGGTLASRRAGFAGQFRRIADLVATLADAIQFAHERGILHRDLKPGNILFDDAGRPYVSDFGLAKFIEDAAPVSTPQLTKSAGALGTPHYLAPEVAAGGAKNVTIAGDVYGLGTILYELLAGRPPFEADGPAELLRKIAEETPKPPSYLASRLPAAAPRPAEAGTATRIPRDLEVICLHCLAKEPGRRYPTAAALADDLRRWLDGRAIQARPVAPGERLWRWARRNPAVAALSLTLVLGLSIGAFMLTRTNRRLANALHNSRQSEAKATESLYSSLLSQAHAQRQSGQVGQRYDTLETIRRAARIRSSVELRTEAAAALARPDLRRVSDLPRYYAGSFSTIDFSPDFTRYVCGRPQGFVLRAASNGEIIRSFNGAYKWTADYVQFSDDGRWISVVDTGRNLEVWSVDGTNSSWRRARGGTGAPLLAFRHDGTGFAYISADGRVQLRSLVTKTERSLTPAGAACLGMSFAPGDERLALARTNALELWSTATGEKLWSLNLTVKTRQPAWRADGFYLAVGESDNGDVSLIRAADGHVVRTLHGHSRPVLYLAFHPHGQILASLGDDLRLRFWDLESGTGILQYPAAPRGLRFSQDGRQLGFAPENLGGAVFDVAPDAVYREWVAPPTAAADLSTAVRVSADGRLVATSDGREVRIWDARAGRQVAAFEAQTGEQPWLRFEPVGQGFLYAGTNGVVKRTLHYDEGRGANSASVEIGPEQPFAPGAGVHLHHITPDGKFWVAHRGGPRWMVWPEGRVEAERLLTEGPDFREVTVSVSPDVRWLAGEPAQGSVRGLSIWDTVRSQWATNLPVASHIASAFTPDGRWLLTGSPSNYRAWEVGTWRQAASWSPRPGAYARGGVHPAPNSKMAALMQPDGTFQLVAVGTWEELVTLHPPSEMTVESVAWSPDSQRLYVLGARQRLFVWDLAQLRRELAKLGLDWAE